MSYQFLRKIASEFIMRMNTTYHTAIVSTTCSFSFEIHLKETICTSFDSSRRPLAKSKAISKYFWCFGILNLSNKEKKAQIIAIFFDDFLPPQKNECCRGYFPTLPLHPCPQVYPLRASQLAIHVSRCWHYEPRAWRFAFAGNALRVRVSSVVPFLRW